MAAPGLDAGQGGHFADVPGNDGDLAGEIEETFVSHPSGELLASRPGTGPRTGARILAGTGDGPAFASLRDPASQAFYDRKRAEGKRHNAALICLARRRDVIVAMPRTGQPCQPARPAPGLPRAA